jgi:RNA polymerase sigma-70 factor (ECF subfamily)
MSISAKDVLTSPLPWFGVRFQTKAVKISEPLLTPLPVWDDAELVGRMASGEPDALGLIYDRYAPSLFRLLSALLESPADAEDALQEVFVALATSRTSRIRDLKAYLFVAARHQAFTQLRKRKREPVFGSSEEMEAVAEPTSPGISHDFATLLSRLPLEQREVIALKVWEEMTFAEIAQLVGASPNTVMSRYRYGIEKLRAWCGEENHE